MENGTKGEQALHFTLLVVACFVMQPVSLTAPLRALFTSICSILCTYTLYPPLDAQPDPRPRANARIIILLLPDATFGHTTKDSAINATAASIV